MIWCPSVSFRTQSHQVVFFSKAIGQCFVKNSLQLMFKTWVFRSASFLKKLLKSVDPEILGSWSFIYYYYIFIALPFTRDRRSGVLYNVYTIQIGQAASLLLTSISFLCFQPVGFSVQSFRWSLAGVWVAYTRQEVGPLPTQWPTSPVTTTSNSLQLSSRTGVWTLVLSSQWIQKVNCYNH